MMAPSRLAFSFAFINRRFATLNLPPQVCICESMNQISDPPSPLYPLALLKCNKMLSALMQVWAARTSFPLPYLS